MSYLKTLILNIFFTSHVYKVGNYAGFRRYETTFYVLVHKGPKVQINKLMLYIYFNVIII